MHSVRNSATREKRQAVRKALLGKALFISLKVSTKLTSTIDLSTGGLSLSLPAPLEIGQACAVSFDVPMARLNQRALVTGRVASCIELGANDYRVGIRFVQADPVSRELVNAAVANYLSVTV